MQNKTNTFFSPYPENRYAIARRMNLGVFLILAIWYFSYDSDTSNVLPFSYNENTVASSPFISERYYMKQYFMPALLAATAAIALNAHAAPVAIDNTTGMVRFTGEFNASACDLASTDINGGATVPLGSYKTTNLTVANPTTPIQNYPITLTNCDTSVAKKARLSFTGFSDLVDPTLLQLQLGGATGVAVELFDSTNNKLNLGSQSALMPLVAGSNTYQLGARYRRTAPATGSVTAGKANAQATIVISYDDGL
ncbi:fimbrial protein [Paraherbaspirillum soli]|uniref:Fimbrial protein n=1 Tax=Paraherbaspirillum soli TaxID=631222 RepID=A0ABW0MBE0_9BURK